MSGQRVAVVGRDDEFDVPGGGAREAADETGLAAAIEAAGGRPVEAASVDEAAVVVADGEAALVDLARRGVDTPVLPVDAGPGTRSVSAADVTTAVERVLADEADVEPRPVLRLGPDEVALFDVGLMAGEPARISAFSIRYEDAQVAEFRADGVVAATPAGSVGYTRAADGPLIAPGTDAVAVVPIAPFATDADRWVLPPGEVTLAVERDETPVELLLDGRIERSVPPGEPIALSPAAGLDLLVVPESRPFF